MILHYKAGRLVNTTSYDCRIMILQCNCRGLSYDILCVPSLDDQGVWEVKLFGTENVLGYFEPVPGETRTEMILDAVAVAEAELEEQWLEHTRILMDRQSTVSA